MPNNRPFWVPAPDVWAGLLAPMIIGPPFMAGKIDQRIVIRAAVNCLRVKNPVMGHMRIVVLVEIQLEIYFFLIRLQRN